MFACCEDGYCESEERALSADIAFGEGWESLAIDPMFARFVSADDVEGGEPETWDPPRWHSRP